MQIDDWIELNLKSKYSKEKEPPNQVWFTRKDVIQLIKKLHNEQEENYAKYASNSSDSRNGNTND